MSEDIIGYDSDLNLLLSTTTFEFIRKKFKKKAVTNFRGKFFTDKFNGVLQNIIRIENVSIKNKYSLIEIKNNTYFFNQDIASLIEEFREDYEKAPRMEFSDFLNKFFNGIHPYWVRSHIEMESFKDLNTFISAVRDDKSEKIALARENLNQENFEIFKSHITMWEVMNK